MSDTAQLIKDKLNIADFLRQYVELKPAGKNFKALCPFHKEKTPSFIISPDRQSWHCFGSCSEGGDIIKFLMKYENLEFYDALKILAEKAGVTMQSAGRDFQANNALYKALEAAKDFYKTNFANSGPVKNYLKERGLQEEIILEFELGFAPDNQDGLTKHLLKLGHRISDLERAGLIFKTDRGMYCDRFRGRVMFPIYNHVGKAVAFTGRVLPGSDNPNVGKYVNSPETPIFQKSKILYGFHRTKNDIREAKQAVVVEGQMDFLMLWQDGVKNVVASSGTALTSDHLVVLRRLADELVLSFDADEAGQLAAERSIDLAGGQDFLVKLLIIPEAELKDPADVVKSRPGLIKTLVEQSKSAMEYYFHRYLKELPKDIKSKKQNLRVVLSKIKSLSSPIDRSHWLKELAALAGIEEKVLAEEMEALPSTAVVPVSRNLATAGQAPPKEDLSRRDLILQRLLGVLFHMKKDLEFIKGHLQYFPEQYLELYKNAFEGRGAKSGDLEDLMNRISLQFSFENPDAENADLEEEAQELLRQLKIEHLRNRRREIKEKIRILDQSGEETGLQKAKEEFQLVSQELKILQG